MLLVTRKIIVYTDGAARGNPGPSASGFMVYEDRKLLHSAAQYNGRETNNFAEYRAVALALSWCLENLGMDCSIELYCDNELVVRQLNGLYKIKSSKLMPLNEEIKEIASRFKAAQFRNLRRENIYIKAVDRSLNVLLDEMNKTTGAL